MSKKKIKPSKKKHLWCGCERPGVVLYGSRTNCCYCGGRMKLAADVTEELDRLEKSFVDSPVVHNPNSKDQENYGGVVTASYNAEEDTYNRIFWGDLDDIAIYEDD